MNPYDKYILPKITNKLCASGPNMKQRAKIIPRAHGTVLEVGVGSGLNFQYYDASRVDHLFALDPSEDMWAIAEGNLDSAELSYEYVKAGAEDIPLDSGSVDSVVITYTLCTIGELQSSFEEMRRVLRPGGELIFCEHGKAPDPAVRRWQNFLNPVWKRLGGGCNLNRDIPKLIRDGGFEITDMETMYIPGFKPACFNFWGTAVPR